MHAQGAYAKSSALQTCKFYKGYGSVTACTLCSPSEGDEVAVEVAITHTEHITAQAICQAWMVSAQLPGLEDRPASPCVPSTYAAGRSSKGGARAPAGEPAARLPAP